MMIVSNRLLVGTALSLLLAAPGVAWAGTGTETELPLSNSNRPLILAQAEDPGAAEEPATECPAGTAPAPDGEGCVAVEEEEPASAEEAPSEEAPSEEAPPEADETAPDAEAPAEPSEEPVEPAPEEEAPTQEAPAEEAPPETDEAAPDAEAPAESFEQPAEPAPEETDTTAEPEAPAPAGEEPVEETEPTETVPDDVETLSEPEVEAPAEEPATDTGEEEPALTEEPSDAAPEDEAQPVEEEPTDGAEQEQPTEADEPATTDAEDPAAGEEVDDDCPAGTRMSGTAGECIPVEETEDTAEELTPAEEEAEPEATAPEGEAEQPAEAEPETDEQAAPDDEPTPEQEDEAAQEDEDAAPVLDSQKEEGAEAPEEAEAEEEQPTEDEQPQEQQAEETDAPESDDQAQQDLLDPEQVRQEIRSIVEEEGQRIELGQTPEDRQLRRRQLYQTRESARVIEEYNDNRTIVEINNNVYIESPDYDRIVLRDDLVYYEELRGGRVREVIERPDGTRVITVRNSYGDVVRRVRVTPDGREYVLAYVPDDRYEAVARFENPARDLPPLRLTIPVSEYILEAETVQDPDRYYTFLEQPPVEPVRRLYSLEEVRYSARVRDMMRRVDVDTIEFEFGSARIEEREIADIEALANAMLRILDENPAETFLIEGHTDAVGSENANLALSDRRAEAVARALTDVFGLPPENLVTQGYGEQYLKVNTDERERENRRVAVRRITPLVSPVASRQ